MSEEETPETAQLSDDAKAMLAAADAAIPDAPTIEPGEEPDYAVGEVSPEGEIRTVKIYGRDVPVGLLTELADPKCTACWSNNGSPLQGSYVATRVGSRGQPVRQRQLCECCVRRYVKKYPKEPREARGPKVTRAVVGDNPWVEHAMRLKRQLDKVGAQPDAHLHVDVLAKLQRRYDRARGRAGLA